MNAGAPAAGPPVVDLLDVSQQVRGGQLTLNGISLTIGRGELVAIIGGSGTGKTTLLDTMCGLRPPAAGEVRRDGAQGRHGYVPQDDIIHLTLPLRRTLHYTAQLRLPAAATPEQTEHAVTDVLKALELTDRAGLPVGSLSGGQRKRASIAAELLTRPRVFFLDEPTSGLDPARGAELMRTLRRLADEGTTVVLTTHNPLDAQRCDKVAVLADRGYLACFGPPADACAYFAAGDLSEVYEKLAGQDAPESWGQRFTEFTVAQAAAPPAPEPGGPNGSGPLTAAASLPPGIGSVRQWLLLTRRNAEILARSRLTLAILIGSPILVTLVLSSAAALALGLLISAAVSEPAQATIAMPMVCFPQVLFAGAILPVPVMAVAGRWISYAMSNRWASEGLGHSFGVDRLWAAGGSPLGPPLLASYGATFSHPVAVDLIILGGFTVAFLAATCAVIVRKTRA